MKRKTFIKTLLFTPAIFILGLMGLEIKKKDSLKVDIIAGDWVVVDSDDEKAPRACIEISANGKVKMSNLTFRCYDRTQKANISQFL